MQIKVEKPGRQAVPACKLPVGSFGIEENHPEEIWLRISHNQYVCFSQFNNHSEPLPFTLDEVGSDLYSIIPLEKGCKIEFSI